MRCFIIKLHGETIGNIQAPNYARAFSWADEKYGQCGEITIMQVHDSEYRAAHGLRYTKGDPEWIG